MFGNDFACRSWSKTFVGVSSGGPGRAESPLYDWVQINSVTTRRASMAAKSFDYASKSIAVSMLLVSRVSSSGRTLAMRLGAVAASAFRLSKMCLSSSPVAK